MIRSAYLPLVDTMTICFYTLPLYSFVKALVINIVYHNAFISARLFNTPRGRIIIRFSVPLPSKGRFWKKIKKYSYKPIDRICFLQYYKPINQTGDMSDEETTAVSDHQSPLVERANVRHTMYVTGKPFVERR